MIYDTGIPLHMNEDKIYDIGSFNIWYFIFFSIYLVFPRQVRLEIQTGTENKLIFICNR